MRSRSCCNWGVHSIANLYIFIFYFSLFYVIRKMANLEEVNITFYESQHLPCGKSWNDHVV